MSLKKLSYIINLILIVRRQVLKIYTWTQNGRQTMPSTKGASMDGLQGLLAT